MVTDRGGNGSAVDVFYRHADSRIHVLRHVFCDASGGTRSQKDARAAQRNTDRTDV